MAGCSAPSKKTSSLALFSEAESNLKSEDIKNELTRSDSLYGFWQVEAYPFTKALIEKEEKELGAKNMDSSEKISEKIKNQNKALVDSGTCFMVTVYSSQSIDTAKFSSWKVRLEDSQSLTFV